MISLPPLVSGSLCSAEEYKKLDFLRDNFVCFRIHRIAWFAVLHVLRQLWKRYDVISTAPCFWQSLVRCVA